MEDADGDMPLAMAYERMRNYQRLAEEEEEVPEDQEMGGGGGGGGGGADDELAGVKGAVAGSVEGEDAAGPARDKAAARKATNGRRSSRKRRRVSRS